MTAEQEEAVYTAIIEQRLLDATTAGQEVEAESGRSDQARSHPAARGGMAARARTCSKIVVLNPHVQPKPESAE
jgi:hypothetical protein